MPTRDGESVAQRRSPMKTIGMHSNRQVWQIKQVDCAEQPNGCSCGVLVAVQALGEIATTIATEIDVAADIHE